MSSIICTYEFSCPIRIKVQNQIKQAKTTLSVDKRDIYSSNWNIPIKHLCSPIVDQDEQIIRLKDDKGTKEFLCAYGLASSSLSWLHRNQKRSRKGSKMNQDSHSLQKSVPPTLQEFLQVIENRILKYQQKHVLKNSTPDLTSESETALRPNRVSQSSRARGFGNRNWATRTNRSRPKRVYGGNTKKQRKMMRMLRQYDIDNSDEEPEEEKPEEMDKDDEPPSGAMEETDTKQNHEATNTKDLQEDVCTPVSNKGRDTLSQTSNESIAPPTQSKKTLPKKKKRRLRHSRILESDESEDDDFGTPVLVQESEGSSVLGSSDKEVSTVSSDLEPSNLPMEDVESVSMRDEETINLAENNEIVNEEKSMPQDTNTATETNGAVVSVEKKTSSISSFFQPRASKQNKSQNRNIDNHDNDDNSITNIIQKEDSKDPREKNFIRSTLKSPANAQSSPPTINVERKETMRPTPSLPERQANTPPSAKRALTSYFTKAITPSTSSSASIASSPKDTVKTPNSTAVKNPYNCPRQILPSGLSNLGNTCYLNSSLQLLFSLPGFFNSLLKCSTGEKYQKDQSSPFLYSTLMNLYQSTGKKINKGKTLSASNLKKCIDGLSKRFVGYEQRDAHEFLSDLIDLLHEEMSRKLPQHNLKLPMLEDSNEEKESNGLLEKNEVLPTDSYFCMKVKVCLTCDSCNYSRCKEEMYRHLSLDVDTTKNIDETTLKEGLDHFFAPEKRDITCEKCKVGKVATQTMEILHKPKALLLHLKRFIVVPPSNNSGNQVAFRKNRIAVDFPFRLELDKNGDKARKSMDDAEYRLKSLVHHIGPTAYCGHYRTDAFRDDKWIRFDDGSVTETRTVDVMDNTNVRRNVYMLLYELKD